MNKSLFNRTTPPPPNLFYSAFAGGLAKLLTFAAVIPALFFSACTDITDPKSSTPVVTGVTVSPPNPAVTKGETLQFTAEVTGANNPAQTVNWSVEGGNGSAISAEGVLTVPAGEAATTLTVKATSAFDTTKYGQANVTLIGGGTTPPTPAVTGVSVNPATTSVAKGGTQQFTATVNVTGGAAQTVTWSVDGGGAGTVMNGNILSVAAGETASALTVRATSTADPSKSGTAIVTVTVTPPPQYTVTYSSNGGSGTTPAAQTVAAGSGITLPDQGGMTREGHIFDGWDSAGTTYLAGASYTVNGSVTLYAQWTAITYTVAYNGNGNTGGTTASSGHTYDVPQTLAPNGFTRTGHAFAGWNTQQDGGGTNYTGGQSVTNLAATQGATVTLYAQWTAITYTVAYNGNGNTGGTTASSIHTYGVYKNLTANGFTRTGYAFAGWNTQADGGGTSYAGGASVTNLTATHGATVTLYAQWTLPAGLVTVNFTGLPQDEDITLSEANWTLSWSANTALAISVSGSGFTAYRWMLDSETTPRGTGASLTLYAGRLSVKQHTLTVLVTKSGVEYSKRVTFTVTQ